MAPKKNHKKKPNGKGRADEVSADFGYDASEPDVEIKDEETAADLKVRGNECVKSGDHAVAVKLFTANSTSVLFYFLLYLCTFVSCLH